MVESHHHASPYSTFRGISNLSRVDVILASGHMTSCIVRRVFVYTKFGELLSFISANLIPESHAKTHIETPTFEVMACGPTRTSSSLSSTLVSLSSPVLCVCLNLASVHRLGVLDDALPSSVIS